LLGEFYGKNTKMFHWYGISGYIVAAGTGAFRIINDKHWLSDAAGAGFEFTKGSLKRRTKNAQRHRQLSR
jgi:hypothetical protein